jgi:hypothetical protein
VLRRRERTQNPKNGKQIPLVVVLLESILNQ